MTENESIEPAEPQPQPTSQRPLNPDLMGYPSVEALVAAKRASDVEGKRLRGELDKTEALLREMLANGDAPRQAVPDRRGTRPEDRLTELGVPADAVSELVDARVSAALEPITRSVQARQRVLERHPGYAKFENEINEFLRSNPARWRQFSELLAASPEAALEWGIDAFATHEINSFGVRQLLNGGDSPTHAAIPTSRSGDGRRAPSQDGAVQEAFERFQKTGSQQDAQAYAKARLKGVIPDRHLWPDGGPS